MNPWKSLVRTSLFGILSLSLAEAQQYIHPIDISSNDYLDSGTFEQTIDNTSSTDYSPSYVYKSGAYETLNFQVDLGNSYQLSELYFWNYHVQSLMTTVATLEFRDPLGSTVGTWVGQPDLGVLATEGFTSQTLDLGSISNVRTIDVTLSGSTSGVKFADIGFGAVPEPSVSLIAGVIGMLMFIRHRRR